MSLSSQTTDCIITVILEPSQNAVFYNIKDKLAKLDVYIDELSFSILTLCITMKFTPKIYDIFKLYEPSLSIITAFSHSVEHPHILLIDMISSNLHVKYCQCPDTFLLPMLLKYIETNNVMVPYLLYKLKNINASDNNGYTPLIVATDAKQYDIVEEILSYS